MSGIYSWTTGSFSLEDVFGERRIANLQRFAGELIPYPLQSRKWDWRIAAQ